MISLRRIDIRNFVCFDHIVVAPSVDPEKRLTVIRAENGSGKTTFLRAIRWGMYGEQGLPGASTKTFSIHPADWRPDEEGIVTTVEIEFETDGSTRVHSAAGGHPTVYNLTRRVTTIRNPTTRADEPDYRRVQETARLMKKRPDERVGTGTPPKDGDRGTSAMGPSGLLCDGRRQSSRLCRRQREQSNRAARCGCEDHEGCPEPVGDRCLQGYHAAGGAS